MKQHNEFISCARQLIGFALLFLIVAMPVTTVHAQKSFGSDAVNVNSTTIAETYCSSIDGVDFSLDTYFPNQAAAESKFGKAIVSRGGGVCCTGVNPLLSGGACQACPTGTEYSGGACVATTTSCAAIGQILVNGKCQVAVPPNPTFPTTTACLFTPAWQMMTTNPYVPGRGKSYVASVDKYFSITGSNPSNGSEVWCRPNNGYVGYYYGPNWTWIRIDSYAYVAGGHTDGYVTRIARLPVTTASEVACAVPSTADPLPTGYVFTQQGIYSGAYTYGSSIRQVFNPSAYLTPLPSANTWVNNWSDYRLTTWTGARVYPTGQFQYITAPPQQFYGSFDGSGTHYATPDGPGVTPISTIGQIAFGCRVSSGPDSGKAGFVSVDKVIYSGFTPGDNQFNDMGSIAYDRLALFDSMFGFMGAYPQSGRLMVFVIE